MRLRSLGALVIAAVSLTATSVQAQNVMVGEQIAKIWCSGCHQIDNRAPKRGSDAVPSFSSVAQMSSTTAMSLTVFLSTSHGRMPDYALSRTEIQNVSAYILSLCKPPQ